MTLGYDDELPAGYQDADLEMRELAEAANEAEAQRGYIEDDDFDVHDGGQLRIGVAGDQRPLLALSDDEIPQGHVDPPALPGDDGFRYPWEAHRRHPDVPGQMEVEDE